MADFSITLLDFTFSFHAIMNITVNNLKKICLSAKKRNASSRIRTDDLVITSDAPYQLGHQGLNSCSKT